MNDGVEVVPELPNMDSPADLSPLSEPFHAPPVDLDRAIVISALDVQVHHRRLKDSPIQLADRSLLFAPGVFQRFVCFEELFVVKISSLLWLVGVISRYSLLP